MAFSLMTVCVKHLNGRLPVAQIVLARALISLLITHIMIKKIGISAWGNQRVFLLIRGLLGTGALFCVFTAIQKLTLASATVIQYTYPTFTAIAGLIFLQENLRKRIGIAVIIGWIGITFVVQPSFNNIHNFNTKPLLGTLIGLTGALLTALAYICVRKLSIKEHPLVIVYYFPLVSIPITIPFILKNAVMPIGQEWLWISGIGLFTQLGQILITKGLSLLPAAQASAISYVQVIFASIWGILFFSEPINHWMIAGALLVLFSTLLSLNASPSPNLRISKKVSKEVKAYH